MNDLKVKFHSLERLELTDINAIQDIAETIRDDYAGNLFGAEGALTKLSFDYTTNTVSFDDFAFLGKKDLTNTGNLNRAFLGVYDASKATSTENLDVTSLISDVNDHRIDNQELPTIGGAGLGDFFPYVYVCAFNADSAVATRRVWDLSNAQEQTDSLDTRVERRFKFLFNPVPPTTEAGYTPYVRIGQIWKYALSNGVVSIDEIRTHFVSEDLLGIGDVHPNTIINNSTYDSFKEYQGLKHTLHLIKDFLEKQLTNGSNDPANTTTKSLVEQPTYSLQGLTAKVTNTVRISAHINIQANVTNTSESTIVTVTTEHPEHTNSDGWDEFEAVYLNYKYMKDQLGGFTAATFQTVAHNNISDYTNWLLRLSLFSIQVPEKYQDKPYKVTFTPSFEISPGLGNATEIESIINPSTNTPLGVKHLKTYKVQHVSYSATTENSLKILEETRTVVDDFSTGTTSEVNFTGIHFLISDLDDFFIQRDANGAITDPENRDFNIRVDMEIYQ